MTWQANDFLCEGAPYNDDEMNINMLEAFVFDVDGTLVLSDDPNAGSGGMLVLPGAIDVLRRLHDRGTRYVCFTNGTGQVPSALAARTIESVTAITGGESKIT